MLLVKWVRILSIKKIAELKYLMLAIPSAPFLYHKKTYFIRNIHKYIRYWSKYGLRVVEAKKINIQYSIS